MEIYKNVESLNSLNSVSAILKIYLLVEWRHFSNISMAAIDLLGFIQNLNFEFHKLLSKLVLKFKIMSLQRRREAKYPLQGLADLPVTYGKWKYFDNGTDGYTMVYRDIRPNKHHSLYCVVH